MQREKSWFQAILTDFGSFGPLLLLTACFATFLIIFQMVSRTCACIVLKIRQYLYRADTPKRIMKIFNQLSDWQQGFLAQAIRKDQRQWQSHELGGYDAVLRPEMNVLIQRGIVIKVGYGTFLIEDRFFDTLQEIYLAEQKTTNAESD